MELHSKDAHRPIRSSEKGLKWSKKEEEDLRKDWPGYREGLLSSDQLRKNFGNRTVDSISKKYWKLYGKLALQKTVVIPDFKEQGLFNE